MPYAPKLTRRAERKLHGRVQRPTQDDSGERNLFPLPSTGELRIMQGQDESLQGLHELAHSHANPNSILVVNGLLYQRWKPRNPRYENGGGQVEFPITTVTGTLPHAAHLYVAYQSLPPPD
jgi:hypothetical protein